MKPRRAMRSSSFDREIDFRGHTLRVTGTAEPFIPATGPTMANAGGDPPEGGGIEDLAVVLIRRRKDGTIRKREVEGLSAATLSAIEEVILERLSDEDD